MTPPNARFFASPRFAPYRDALARISARTGASVPSLAASFLVLHEITAIVPFVGVFYASRSLGIGDRLVQSVVEDDMNNDSERQVGLMKKKAREWVDEGGQMAERVGKRYGWFGYEKHHGKNAEKLANGGPLDDQRLGTKLAGDVANVVVAYGITKAILPLRIGASLYLSPSFSRRVFEPIRRGLSRAVKRFRGPGRAM